jgi:hypothetical protein
MTDREQLDHFANDIDNLIDRYSDEYDMSYAMVVGVLEMKINSLCREASKRSDEV